MSAEKEDNGGSVEAEDPAPAADSDRPRPWGISVPRDATSDRIEPGTPRWRMLLLLAISSEDGFTEREREALAERLVEDAFQQPHIADRKYLLAKLGVTEERIREEATALVVQYCWERGRGEDDYRELLARIHYYLGHRISRRFVGPDEHRKRKPDGPDPPVTFTDLEAAADETGEFDEGWLSRRPAPDETERRAAEERWALALDLEDDLRSAAPEGYAEDLIRRMTETPGTVADVEVAVAVRRLLRYRRTEASPRERAVIDAMIAARHACGSWNVTEAHREHYEPPAPADDVGRRQFANDWRRITESLAA